MIRPQDDSERIAARHSAYRKKLDRAVGGTREVHQAFLTLKPYLPEEQGKRIDLAMRMLGDVIEAACQAPEGN